MPQALRCVSVCADELLMIKAAAGCGSPIELPARLVALWSFGCRASAGGSPRASPSPLLPSWLCGTDLLNIGLVFDRGAQPRAVGATYVLSQ